MKPPNDHVLFVGMSGSGKSTLAVEDIIIDAESGLETGAPNCIVCLDPHPRSLANSTFEQLVARGHEHRIIYDRLYDLDFSVGFDWLPRSTATDPTRRNAENELNIRSFADILLRRRGQQSLASSPFTEEWVLKPGYLYVEQDPPKKLNILHKLLVPGSNELRDCIDDCRDPERARPFKALYDGKLSAAQYQPAYRLISSVCTSPAFALRCGATFCFEEFLTEGGILLIEGGSYGTLSNDALRLMLGAISCKTIEYVRNRTTKTPGVKLYQDEAINVGLIGDHECRALAELRKENFGLKILVQDLSFPTSTITEGVLNNTGTHYWFCVSSSKLANQAAADLGNPQLKNSLRSLSVGQCYKKIPGSYQHVSIKRSENPWVYPELLQTKAEQALKRIRNRPEYQTRRPTNRSIAFETKKSNKESEPTPAPSTTSKTCSPIDQIRQLTEGSQNSERGESSDLLEL